MTFFSVIVPVKSLNRYVFENIEAIQKQKFTNWEIIVVTDGRELSFWSDNRIKVICSGAVSPAIKRDLAANNAFGKYLVLLDDDSFMSENYLEIAFKYINESGAKVFGGPAITPRRNTIWQKASGACYESKLMSSSPSRYRSLGKQRLVLDWPSVNLIVQRGTFLSVGGFGNAYWPGEDSKFCEKLNNSNVPIWYLPDLIVYHHRRTTIWDHLRQCSNYGRHRGRFARDKDRNSSSILFVIPLFFVFYIVAISMCYILGIYNFLIFIPLYLYLIAMFSHVLSIILRWGMFPGMLQLLYLPLTHLSYGVNYAIGYMQDNLKSRLR
jgi:GT2 family glycosyltransferase